MQKSEFLSLRAIEIAKTIRLLELFPEERRDLRPAEKTRTALELATTFLGEELINASFARTGTFPSDAPHRPTTPASMAAAIEAIRDATAAVDADLTALDESAFRREVDFFGSRMPLSSALLWMLFDHIHHRGQFTIYSRIAGGKVPQIYGPSADEPWVPPAH